jgi:adenine-specific DNA-methyltransferase
MPRRNETNPNKRPVEQYDHKDKKRLNNPPVGLVDASTDAAEGRKTYAYDPHLDPQLVWAGKAERTSFETPTVSLHVHERIDPRGIVEAVRKKNSSNYEQLSLFAAREENPPLREAIDFYKHAHNWSNRLIAGDSLLVMNSLIEKEGLAGQVQMVYIDPPYGIKYGSNFQPFVNKRDVKDGKDEDLTAEPEMVKAFRDTWELGIHSYLSYLRDRLLLARELLNESGSVFVQISDENVHHVREILDELFGPNCHVVEILVKKKGSQKSSLIDPVNDYLLWYSKTPRESGGVKFRSVFMKRDVDAETLAEFKSVELPDGRQFPVSAAASPDGETFDYRLSPRRLFQDYPKARLFRPWPITNGGTRANQMDPIEFAGKVFEPPKGRCWSFRSKKTESGTTPMERLKKEGRLCASASSLDGKRFLDDFPFKVLSNWWDGLGGASDPIYVVQTNPEIIQRCLLMTTDPGDLVLDITCGSGTTAYVAEQWGRRWITCDTSRVAVTLAKQRLMTAVFDYYRLAHEQEGVGSGFVYKTVPHVTLKSIANNEPPAQETLYDQPLIDNSKARVAGPFTVEAVPAPMVKSPEELASDDTAAVPADESVSRSGETLRQDEWRRELLRAGIRTKGKQMIHFSRVEPLSGTRWLHADAETKEDEPRRVLVSFGPEHAPLEQRQVEAALEEARRLVPKPPIVVFAAFQFDPEAAKDIDELHWPGVTILKAQMNADLFTEDLKKKRSSNESFWLIGQPDVAVRKAKRKRWGQEEELWEVEVKGFDYYNPRSGQIESGGADKIALWMLDTDYDGRSLFPRQVFFPMAGEKEGWARLARNLKAEIDETLIEAYRGTVSLPFPAGKHRRVGAKIVDDRGIESLKLIDLP